MFVNDEMLKACNAASTTALVIIQYCCKDTPISRKLRWHSVRRV